jgi:hypothetical protein
MFAPRIARQTPKAATPAAKPAAPARAPTARPRIPPWIKPAVAKPSAPKAKPATAEDNARRLAGLRARLQRLEGKANETAKAGYELARECDYQVARGHSGFAELRARLTEMWPELDKHAVFVGETKEAVELQQRAPSTGAGGVGFGSVMLARFRANARDRAAIKALEALEGFAADDSAEFQAEVSGMRAAARLLTRWLVPSRTSLSLLAPDWEGQGRWEQNLAEQEEAAAVEREGWDPEFARGRLMAAAKRHRMASDSSRYFDKLEIVGWTHSATNAFTEIELKDGDKTKSVGIALSDLFLTTPLGGFLAIGDLHETKQEAMNTVRKHQQLYTTMHVYSFYIHQSGIIVPTSFSADSVPRFYNNELTKISKYNVAVRKDFSGGAWTFANALNPVPGTTVDEHGKLAFSGNPIDWLSLLKLGRLKRIRQAGPITARRHSGHDVPYTVVGPHDKLTGTSVYLLKDADGAVLYVGKGSTLERLREHIKNPKKTQWFGEISSVEVRATGLTNTNALALEEALIGEFRSSGRLQNEILQPFRAEFGDAMQVGPNLPAPQKPFTFHLRWGHDP